MNSSLRSEPGTYALILQSASSVKVMIGRWREIELLPGYYIYVGSAFGPGGIRARISRHWRSAKRMHWHIDYLRKYVTPLATWISYETERLEHGWAQTLHETEKLSSIKGFGCSDCKCYSHLFYSSNVPDFSLITISKPDSEVMYEYS